MPSRVVIALYRALLQSTRTLQRDVEAGRTLFAAVRSGAVASYAGVKSDWQRERMFVRRFEDMAVLAHRGRADRAYAAIVGAGFRQPLASGDKEALDARIDAAFEALKGVDDHNALIQDFKEQETFGPKERTNAVQFLVGDVVEVKGEKRGVIFAWHVISDGIEAAAGPRVVYDILPHSPGFSFASKMYNVPQDEVRLDEAPKAVVHPSLLLYFDGFDGTHHIASAALAARYPTDVAGKPKDAEVVVSTPSIIQLQSADEEKLLTYLRCNDSTIVQFVMASLEGIWIGECGQSAQNEVQRAVELAGQKKWDEAREMLQQVVHDFPEYAYAWNKLAMVEYQSSNFGKALGHYETAIKLKPQLVEALVGLGTCATRLQRWSLVHRAAVQLLEVQPSNDTARMLIEQAVYATFAFNQRANRLLDAHCVAIHLADHLVTWHTHASASDAAAVPRATARGALRMRSRYMLLNRFKDRLLQGSSEHTRSKTVLPMAPADVRWTTKTQSRSTWSNLTNSHKP